MGGNIRSLVDQGKGFAPQTGRYQIYIVDRGSHVEHLRSVRF